MNFNNDNHQLNQIPKLFWGSLEKKLQDEIFDAGEVFSLSIDENNEYHAVVIAENGVKKEDPNSIYLIDHAWTYEAEHAGAILQAYPSITKRMADLMDISYEDNGEVIKEILIKMWKYNGTYQLRKMEKVNGKMVIQSFKDEDYIPMWYILDEFGSRISHSDNPNVVFQNFYHALKGYMVTVMYPIKDLKEGDELFRDFAANIHGSRLTKDARLHPIIPDKLNIECIEDNWVNELLEIKDEKDRCEESTPIDQKCTINDLPLKVYSTSNYVHDFLKSDKFVIVEDQIQADIIFLNEHFKDFRSLGHRFVNQIPNEKILTCKDLFAETGRRFVAYEYKNDKTLIPQDVKENRGPKWLPTTFNLHTELPQFIKYFKTRENNQNVDNTWIVKPWNLARSLDHTVSNNLDQIIQLAGTGPKIVCKYIDNPVLYHRRDIGWVKQDYRYCIYVKNVQPLEAYIHKVFWIRFGNKPFELADFYDFQKHFTHMWYKNCELLEVPYTEYIPIFNEMYPHLKWSEIQKKINAAIKELLVSASTEKPPHGLGSTCQCRAFYGIDLMLQWVDEEHTDVQPKLLEANFNSDIKRACRDVPGFVDEMFELLFLGDISENFIKL